MCDSLPTWGSWYCICPLSRAQKHFIHPKIKSKNWLCIYPGNKNKSNNRSHHHHQQHNINCNIISISIVAQTKIVFQCKTKIKEITLFPAWHLRPYVLATPQYRLSPVHDIQGKHYGHKKNLNVIDIWGKKVSIVFHLTAVTTWPARFVQNILTA